MQAVAGTRQIEAAQGRFPAGAGRAIAAVLLFSAFTNAVLLAVPVFLLLVYDRVLIGQSAGTLAALSAVVTFVIVVGGVIDLARMRLLGRLAQAAEARLAGQASPATEADLEALTGVIASPVAAAAADCLFVPLFLLALAVLHPVLGAIAAAGACLLILAAGVHHLAVRDGLHAAERLRAGADAALAEAVLAGEARAGAAWHGKLDAAAALRRDGRRALLAAGETSAAFAAAGRAFRQLLQAGIVAAAALLALDHALSAGGMAAAMLLTSRALAPVDQLAAGWGRIAAARQSLHSLAAHRTAPQPAATPGAAARAARGIAVSDLAVIPPGARRPAVSGVSFRAAPGEVVGVIGPSGAGKSALAMALAGLWPAARGTIRGHDPARPAPGDAAPCGAAGYLPQGALLLSGTVAGNIAGFRPDADPAGIAAAARRAGAERSILGLDGGYETPVAAGGLGLSAGEARRVALARALWGSPAVVILDEPDAGLDAAASADLAATIGRLRADGVTVILIASRPATLGAADHVLALDAGRQVAFGPRDDVLREVLRAPPAPGSRQAGDRAAWQRAGAAGPR